MSSVENISLVARTGRVAFDAMGDRLFAEYKVVNIQRGNRGAEPEQVVVGNYSFSNVSISKLQAKVNTGRCLSFPTVTRTR